MFLHIMLNNINQVQFNTERFTVLKVPRTPHKYLFSDKQIYFEIDSHDLYSYVILQYRSCTAPLQHGAVNNSDYFVCSGVCT